MKNRLLTLLLMCAIITINAQTTAFQDAPRGEVQIGDGTLKSNYPVRTRSNYSYTQTIYMASELGGTAGDITKIWYYYPGSSLLNTNTWEIYMGNTTKSKFNNQNDFIPVTEMTKVFDASFPELTEAGWVEFDITDFHYDGTSNLVIAVHDKAPGNDGNSNGFYCTDLKDSSIKRTIIAREDDADIDVSNPYIDNYYYYDYESQIIPNIRILFGTQQAHDLSIFSVSDSFILDGESLTPQITVKNEGVNAESNFTVNLKISGTSYDETVTVTNSIANGETLVVNMPEWTTPAAGNYEFTAKVTLAGDTNTDNDKKVVSFDVIDPDYGSNVVWTCSTDTGDVRKHGPIAVDTGIYTPIAEDFDLAYSIVCGEFIDGVIYGIEYKKNNVYVMVPDGRKKKVGTLQGIGQERVAGLAYDPVEKKKYLLAFNVDEKKSKLYTVDDNWNCTLVGNINKNIYGAIATDEEGHLFAIDMESDQLMSINKQTAAPRAIGAIGYDIEFAQDIGGDHITGDIYGTLHDNDYIIGRFGKFDTSTGQFIQIAELDDKTYGMCAVIPGTNQAVEEYKLNVNIYPNPSKGTFYFDLKDNYTAKAQVFDVTGKTLSTKELSQSDNVIRIENTGMYFIKVSNNNGNKTFKVIVNK